MDESDAMETSTTEQIEKRRRGRPKKVIISYTGKTRGRKPGSRYPKEANGTCTHTMSRCNQSTHDLRPKSYRERSVFTSDKDLDFWFANEGYEIATNPYKRNRCLFEFIQFFNGIDTSPEFAAV